MGTAIRLSEAIELFEVWRRSNKFSENTIVNDREALKLLIRVTGDIQVRNINERHFDLLFLQAAKTRRNSSLNTLLSNYLAFFNWCARRKYIGRHDNPLADRTYFSVDNATRRRVPVHDFPRLLAAGEARHPRNRMIIALGLYLLLRGSEATAIRIGDVDRAQGKIRVHVFKSKKTVWMPICAELDQELQRWLTWYAEWAQRALGRELDDQWYLVPAKDPFRYELDPVTKKFARQASAAGLRPTTRIQRVFDVAKTVLVAAGYPVTDPDGQPTWDGMHTLRRSGARALWDSLLKQGFDRATFRVQAMLHHKDPKTTLYYIGYDEEEAELMRTLRGQVMYPDAQPAANVVDLAGRRNER